MKRREVLVSMALSGAAMALPGCAKVQAPAEGLSEDQLRAMLQLNGMDLQPDEAPKVRASFLAGRFTTAVDPAVQPQSDFDADVDP